MPYILAGTASKNNSTNRPLKVDPPATSSKNSSRKLYRWRNFTRKKKGSKSSLESTSSDSTTATTTSTTTTSSSSSNTSYSSEGVNGGEVCPSPIIQGDDDGKAGHLEAPHAPLNGRSSPNCTTAAGTGSIPQFTNTVVAGLQGNSDGPLANTDASAPSSVAASQSPPPTSHYHPSNNHPCYIEEEEAVTEVDYSTSTVQSLFQLLLPPLSIHDSHPSSLSTANSDQVIAAAGNNSALSTTTGRPTSIAASETSTLRPRTTSSYDRPTSRPLSSYFRDPLPGDSPPLPSLSVSASPLESEDMTSLASSGRPSSTAVSNSNGNKNGRDARQSYHHQQQHDNDANVSAQIMDLANMIVSPVPQHRIHVVPSGEDHLVSPRSSSLLNGQGQLPGQLQPGHYSYPSQQQDQHQQQWQSSRSAAFPSTSMNNDTDTSSRNQPPPPPTTTKSRHRAQEEYEDYGDLTLEEMQELALSKANTRNSSMTNFSIYNNGVVDNEAPLPPVPSIPPAFNNSNTPQSSFSVITDNNASAYNGDHIAATSGGSSSKARRRDPSSDNSMMNDHHDSPPKPKLRNLDTSVSAARGRVSSFFGGISNSLSGNNNHTPNTTSSATPSSTSYPSAMALREGSPLPLEGIHQPSSSYPSTSHMQPPSASSVPQSRSHSQPLQHQQTIPQYAIPPPPTLSQSQAQAQYAHHQQQASSSTSTHLHPASRSSFYGLDAHAQGQGGGGADHEGQQQRWRSERRASPSTIASSSAGGSRPASQSVPRSDTGHYTSPSLGASSSSNYGGQGGAYYSGSNEAGAPGNGGNSRRRVTSWTTRSNASSVYGLNMASPQLAPSNSGDLLPLPSIPGGSNVPPVPYLTQAHLRPGQGVSLLSHQKTLDMYRANVKKTNDPEVTFELAQFMLGLAKEMAIQEMNANANAQQYFSNGGFALHGVSEENLLSSLNHGINDTATAGDSTSPSPDPSLSFHSRSSGSSGDLQSAAIAANRTFSSQGLNHTQQGGPVNMNAAGLQRRRGSHSPAPSISTAARLSAVGMNRTGSPTSAHGGANAANGSNNNDRRALVAEALSLLKRSADRGHVASQYFLADIYANGGLETNKSGVSRASLYALLPGGGSHSHNNGTGSGNVSPLEMKMNPSPTGSSASLGQANTGFVSASSAPAVTSSHQKPDFDKALPLFIAAAKHGHIPSCYRAGECFENGWGCRKDATKAVQFYRKSAASSFPEAMYRLGMAELNGELGLKDRQKDGFKWLKQVAALAESNNENSSNNGGGSVQMNGANSQDGLNGFSSSPSGVFGLDDPSDINGSGNNNNQGTRLCTVQALHELALLHERGIHNVVFVDNEYAAELLARASELGYAPSAYKLGECYEYGRMGCPQDAALSIHYYNIAAQQNHREACFALTAWYLVGSPGVLPQSDTEAYLWAKKAAEQGLAKAEYAVGYFTEVGIGTIKDEREAIQWFTKAAEHGDKRAITRLRALGLNSEAIVSPPMSPRSARMSVGPNSMTGHSSSGGGKKKGSRASNARNSSASRDQTTNSAEMVDGAGGGSSNGAPPAKEKRRSRRSTIPGIMGMSNKEDVPPVPGISGGGKKSDADCIIS